MADEMNAAARSERHATTIGGRGGAVEHDDSGVALHPDLQSTTNPSVFAAGGPASTPGPPLTPVAVFEAKVAASSSEPTFSASATANSSTRSLSP